MMAIFSTYLMNLRARRILHDPRNDLTDAYLSEHLVKFSRFSPSGINSVWIFAAVNLFGVCLMYPTIYLAAELCFVQAIIISIIRAIYPGLLIYAVVFFIVPLLRVIHQKWRNRSIQEMLPECLQQK